MKKVKKTLTNHLVNLVRFICLNNFFYKNSPFLSKQNIKKSLKMLSKYEFKFTKELQMNSKELGNPIQSKYAQ